MNVLLSVWDKEAALPLAKRFAEMGATLWASAGTAGYLRQAELAVQPLESLTGFDKLLEGRVKTLHPRIFAGILAQTSTDLPPGEPAWDVVIVHLYPFSAEAANWVELIDIGGVSLIRAAAKNFTRTWVIPGPDYYAGALSALDTYGGLPPLEQRAWYAMQAFQLTMAYDARISQAIAQKVASSAQTQLRYGENPHQKAFFTGSWPDILTGKPLSYNNLLDLESASRILKGWPWPACVIIKHTQPCGAAWDSDPIIAYQKALAADPIAAYGGIVVCNFPITESWLAATKGHFIELLAAPDFSKEAIAWAQKHKKATMLVRLSTSKESLWEVRTALDGFLWQERNEAEGSQNPTLRWGERLLRQLYSNAVVIVREGELLAAASGQTARIDAVRLATQRAKARNLSLTDAWLMSDGFFPFTDSIELAAQAGIFQVAAPEGGKNLPQIQATAQKLGLSFVLLPYRHFRH